MSIDDIFFLIIRRPPRSTRTDTLFPYTTLFRSHMVDTVLSFEGERSHQYRILRALKNRFGGTDEIGVFSMQTEGLTEVSNPSALFLTHRDENVTGTKIGRAHV